MALAQESKNVWFAERATQIALQHQEWNKAEQSLKIWDSLKQNNNLAKFYKTRAVVNVKQKKYAMAGRDIESWLSYEQKERPKDVGNHILSLPILFNIKHDIFNSSIITILEQYDMWQSYAVRIQLLMQTQQIAAAQMLAKKARTLYPDNRELLFIEIETKPLNEKIQALELNKLDKDGKLDKRTYQLLATYLFGVGRSLDAEKITQEYLQDDDDIDMNFLLAQFYRAQKKMPELYALMARLTEENRGLPDALYVFMSDVEREQKNIDKANEWLEKSAIDDDKRILLAKEYLIAKQYAKAKQQFDKIAEKLDTENRLEFEIRLLDAWIATEQYPYAIDSLKKVIAQQPNHYSAHMILSSIYLKLEQWSELEKTLINAIKIAPKNSDPYNFLAYTYAQRDIQLLEAEKLAKKALELKKDYYAYQDTLGWIYYKQKKMALAKTWLLNAWQQKKDMEIGEHLIYVFLANNDIKAAETILSDMRLLPNTQAKMIVDLADKIEKAKK